jgi:N-acetylmuramoyl-L-alanine amidase
MRRLRLVAALALGAVAASACATGDRPTLGDSPAGASEETTSIAPTTTDLSARWPALTTADVRVVTSPNGVVVPVLEALESGWRVATPCGKETELDDGAPLADAHVVIDPGHGGSESGAVAENGLTEAELNLEVSRELERVLEAEGLTVQLTRDADYRLPIETRADIVNALSPLLFISIHHNGGEAAQRSTPGTEVFYQRADASSRRLAGLVWEDIVAALSVHEVAWTGGDDAGAIYRSGRDGSDFYGVLRRTAGTPAVLIEAGYLSNPAEADLFARPEVQTAEAVAIARAVLRYLTTDEPGSGYMDPAFRGYGSSGGGTFANCRDPDL